MAIKKMLRYGTIAEQKFVEAVRDRFDILLINGNMLAFAANAMARIVAENNGRIDYLVDPLTHGFQHDLELLKGTTGELKVSIRKMLDTYGDFIRKKILSGQVITPGDFDNHATEVKDFVRKVIGFQRDYVQETAEGKDYYKYLQYAGVPLKPVWLVIPYFCMNAKTYKNWLGINRQLIDIARQEFPNKDLAAELVIEKDLLEDEEILIDKIADNYIKSGITRVMLWIDNFSAFESSKKLLENYVALIKKLTGERIEVYNLYGDYFSVLLCHPDLNGGLKGVCHGLGYGEERAVIPVGGGIPINKYYYPPLHERLSFREVSMLLNLKGYIDPGGSPGNPEKYYQEICNCPTCKEVIKNDMNNFFRFGEAKPVIIKGRYGDIIRQFPTQDAKSLCISHFLDAKLNEWEEISNIPLDKLLQQLQLIGSEYANVLGHNIKATFDLWVDIIQASRSNS
ncbi:MAG: hypothetical protein K6U80_18310 [Firmicutes bacterium]|nr:hypothetical protein [Bacillota bacterium]